MGSAQGHLLGRKWLSGYWRLRWGQGTAEGHPRVMDTSRVLTVTVVVWGTLRLSQRTERHTVKGKLERV